MKKRLIWPLTICVLGLLIWNFIFMMSCNSEMVVNDPVVESSAGGALGTRVDGTCKFSFTPDYLDVWGIFHANNPYDPHMPIDDMVMGNVVVFYAGDTWTCVEEPGASLRINYILGDLVGLTITANGYSVTGISPYDEIERTLSTGEDKFIKAHSSVNDVIYYQDDKQ